MDAALMPYLFPILPCFVFASNGNDATPKSASHLLPQSDVGTTPAFKLLGLRMRPSRHPVA